MCWSTGNASDMQQRLLALESSRPKTPPSLTEQIVRQVQAAERMRQGRTVGSTFAHPNEPLNALYTRALVTGKG